MTDELAVNLDHQVSHAPLWPMAMLLGIGVMAIALISDAEAAATMVESERYSRELVGQFMAAIAGNWSLFFALGMMITGVGFALKEVNQ